MKVILNADHDKLGRKGDVVEVKPGYARNFLLPRKLALPATRGAVRQAEDMRRAREELEHRQLEAARELAQKIEQTKLRVSAKAGEEGQLFGSVTTTDLSEAISEALGVDLDRRRVEIPEPIRTLGSHTFVVHLMPGVDPQGQVEVVSEG